MAKSSLNFYSIYLLSGFLIFGAHGVSIQLYRYSNFTGLAWESNSTLGCTNIPQDKKKYVFSIRTDKCFIAYYHQGCKFSWSEKYLPGDTILTQDQLGRNGFIGSFHICNEEEGGNQLNVDITTYYGRGYDVSPDVLESYKNVCSCVNVPQHVQNMSEWSINNHHNALLAYYERDCSENKWNLTFIRAGRNRGSRSMQYHKKTDSVTGKTYKLKSFGPNPNSTYFQTSCNFSHVITTETPKTFESTTESVIGTNAGNTNQSCQCQEWSNQFVELRAQMAQLKINQEKFERENLQQFRNFTAQLKHDLYELSAK